MNIHTQPNLAQHHVGTNFSPVASERIRALALRAVEGAPALTVGETRELAEAILEHNEQSAQDA